MYFISLKFRTEFKNNRIIPENIAEHGKIHFVTKRAVLSREALYGG
jgi:hypothetical protein